MGNKDYEQKKKKCWLQFCQEKGVNQELNISIFDAFDYIFDRAYALGKQEKPAEETVISGWVAIDEDDMPRLHYDKPERTSGGYWQGGFKSSYLPRNVFPDLTWESDPEPVEIIIKRKKK